jgi:hypothetical protein
MYLFFGATSTLLPLHQHHDLYITTTTTDYSSCQYNVSPSTT